MTSSIVFINYRREDSAGYAGRLFDRLVYKLGRDHVFRDIESIEPGDDFADLIRKRLATCDVLLILIGPRWLTATDPQGRKRLEEPTDLVRMEIAMRLHLTQTFGPAGNLEQDDMNNWVQCTNTARGLIARRYPQNIQAHLGHEDKAGPIGGGRRLRAFYARWEMMMKAENWSQVDLTTKYF